MNEKAIKTVCDNCKSEFSWTVRGDVWPGGKERENIDCPYCGNTVGSVMTSGYISVQKIESNEETTKSDRDVQI